MKFIPELANMLEEITVTQLLDDFDFDK